MLKNFIAMCIFVILCSQLSIAKSEYAQQSELKTLSDTGEIQPLQTILDKLSKYSIERLLEVELERDNNIYIYEIEYLNDKGIVLEIKVDAVSAEVLEIKEE